MSGVLRPSACNVLQAAACVNTRGAILPGRRFPDNVFAGVWDDFLFFDPDWIFDAGFIEKLGILVECVGGSCACLCNIDEAGAGGDPEQNCVLLDKTTTRETYQALLLGPTPGSGWLYRMNAYACMSDVDGWCLYCERNNEIAVMAVRGSGVRDRLEAAIEQLRALPIGAAVDNPPAYGLSARGLPPGWRDRFLREYSKSV